ncbi:MAG TPA: hypothetical protein VNO32_54155 [Candidatus Acidoferrum sp.]|jgi:hypothetical protein|nr:hypothetical protein [Candidatus Acidoferrum sp.]
MRIWIRVISFTVDKDEPELGIVVYQTEIKARCAADAHGGLVLPVDSADLKQLFTPQEFSIDGVKQDFRSAILTERASSDATHLQNSFEVDYSMLDREMVTAAMQRAHGEPEESTVPEFLPDALAWFKTIEDELGAFVHVE